LSNAVKLTAEGTVTLSVTREPAEGSTLMLRFGVQQTEVATEVHHAAGLGLSMARRLVSLMSGTLGVVSEQGEGSTFWFCVPVAAAASQINNEFDPLNTGRILVRTASAELSHKVHGYLRRAGLEAAVSTQSTKAASNGNGNHFVKPVSLLITDSTALKSIPESESSLIGECPILMLGSPAGLPDHALTLKQSNEYLAQPVRCVPLLRAVARMINSRPSRPAGEPGRAILLVEDDHIGQMITKLFLVQMGYQVTLASNGAAAYAAVRKQLFDLILMDCQMPGMDGFEAARSIRKFEAASGAHTPIVALSAGVFKEERDQCYAAGMDDFLSKPLDKLELEAVLYNWLTERKTVIQTAGA
jgi:CheY-like chemotaxis protein